MTINENTTTLYYCPIMACKDDKNERWCNGDDVDRFLYRNCPLIGYFASLHSQNPSMSLAKCLPDISHLYRNCSGCKQSFLTALIRKWKWIFISLIRLSVAILPNVRIVGNLLRSSKYSLLTWRLAKTFFNIHFWINNIFFFIWWTIVADKDAVALNYPSQNQNKLPTVWLRVVIHI